MAEEPGGSEAVTGDGGRPDGLRSTDDNLGSGHTALGRLILFSDAVFAIAITVLVLPLTEAHLSDHQIGAQLLGEWPKIFSFALSFAVIGTYWLAHHRMFRFIVRLDTRLLLINMVFLLFIVFLPFPTSVLGAHGDHPAAVVLYASAISLTGLTSGSAWRYASHGNRLVGQRLDPAFVRYMQLRGLVVPIAFIPSIPVAFADPTLAKYVWLLTIPASVIVGRTHGKDIRDQARLRPLPHPPSG